MKTYDAVVIGGGHNGLVCACYLAKAGLKTKVLEARDIVGGAAATEEFHPGFRNSIASYAVSLLHPKVIEDLNLAAHGLRIVERPISNFIPVSNTEYLKLGGGLEATQAQFAKFSQADADNLPAYEKMLDKAGDLLRELLLMTPPNVGGGIGDMVRALKVGSRMRNLSLNEQRDLLELFTLSAGEMVERWFESEPVKAAFGFDAVVGTFASPYTPETAYVLLHHVVGEVNGKRGAWGHAIGGMGSITQAMAREAEALGVVISTNAPVASITIKDGRGAGVVLADGEKISARIIASNVHPQLLY